MIKELCLVEAEQICNSYFKEALKMSGLESFSFSEHAKAKAFYDQEASINAVLIYREISSGLIEVDFIASLTGAQRKGVATKLLSSLGGAELWLELKETNKPALDFYTKNGFVQVGKREFYYKDGSAALNMLRKQTVGLLNK